MGGDSPTAVTLVGQIIISLWAFVVVTGIGLIAWGAGCRLLGRWVPNDAEDPLLAFHVPLCLGLGMLSYGILVTGLFRLLSSFSVAVVVGALAWISRTQLRMGLLRGLRWLRRRPRGWSVTDRALIGFLLAHGALHLAGALAPPTWWDSVVYHLGLPKLFLAQGHVLESAGSVMSCLHPLLMQMVFSAALALGSECAAQVMNVATAGLVALLLWQVGREWYHQTVGLWAAALLWFTPLINSVAGGAMVDLALAYFVGVALWAYARWEASFRLRDVAFCAVCCGLAMGIKSSGGLFLAVLAARMGWLALRRTASRAGWTALFVWAAVAGMLWLIWPLYNWLTTGIMFCPLKWASIIGMPYAGQRPPWVEFWPFGVEQAGRLAGRLMAALVHLPVVVLWPTASLSSDGWRFSPGPWPLLWAGWLLALPRVDRKIWALAVWCVGTVGLFGLAHLYMSRLLTPVYPWLALIGAYLLWRIQADVSHWLGRWYRTLVMVFAVGNLGLLAAQQSGRLPAALGVVSRERFLTQRVEAYPTIRWANQHLSPGDLVLTMDPRVYYFECNYVMGDPSYQVWLRWDAVPDAKTLVSLLRQRGVTHVLVTGSFADLPAWQPVALWARFWGLWKQVVAHRHVEAVYTHRTSTLYALRAF